jgi:DNA-binding protein HU-beta
MGSRALSTAILNQPWKDKPLNTTELADAVAEANDISKAKAKEVVNSIFSTIIEAAKRGEEVSINGFGRFAVKERPAREGRNPATGAPLKIPASKSLGFKMSKPVGATL